MPATTVDEYAAALPDASREILERIRNLITTTVPDVDESIHYQIPTFSIDGTYLVYVGMWKHHVGLYPIPTLPDKLEAAISPYRTTTATVQFRYKQPIPYDLIERLIAALVPIRRKEGNP